MTRRAAAGRGVSVGIVGGGIGGMTAALSLLQAGFDVHVYERLRIPRTARLQAMSAGNKTRFHLPDGPEQQERDAGMASGATGWSFRAAAWIYQHDASVVDPARSGAAGAPDP